MSYYLGIDIGGTKVKIVVLDTTGRILERQEVPTDDDGKKKESWKKKIVRIITKKTQYYTSNDPEVLQCGISAPGLVNDNNTMILHMPERLKGIENFDWSAKLKRPIRVINDGHSACLAEYESFYRSKGVRHLLMLTLGTGVGGGIIVNGQLYQGSMQRAGHIGHMSLNSKGPKTMTNIPGSLEHAVGNFSVSERTEGQFNSVRELVKAHKMGDPKATEWWLASVEKLAVGLASLTNILSPEYIVLGGGIAAGAGDSLFEPLQAFMKKYEWRPGGHQTAIRQAKLGSFAGAVGAAFFSKNYKK